MLVSSFDGIPNTNDPIGHGFLYQAYYPHCKARAYVHVNRVVSSSYLMIKIPLEHHSYMYARMPIFLHSNYFISGSDGDIINFSENQSKILMGNDRHFYFTKQTIASAITPALLDHALIDGRLPNMKHTSQSVFIRGVSNQTPFVSLKSTL